MRSRKRTKLSHDYPNLFGNDQGSLINILGRSASENKESSHISTVMYYRRHCIQQLKELLQYPDSITGDEAIKLARIIGDIAGKTEKNNASDIPILIYNLGLKTIDRPIYGFDEQHQLKTFHQQLLAHTARAGNHVNTAQLIEGLPNLSNHISKLQIADIINERIAAGDLDSANVLKKGFGIEDKKKEIVMENGDQPKAAHIIPAATLEEVTFPESARAAFIAHIEKLYYRKNPYLGEIAAHAAAIRHKQPSPHMAHITLNKIASQKADHVIQPEKSPYSDHGELQVNLAHKMMELLAKVAIDNTEIEEVRGHATRILEIIDDTQHHKMPTAYVIKNFPIDRKELLLTTPSDPDKFDHRDPMVIGKMGHIAEWAQLAYNTACGIELIQNEFIQEGSRFQHITPRSGQSARTSNAGSGVFPVHTEGAHLPEDKMIDTLMLLTLKNHETPTIVIKNDVIEKELRNNLTVYEFKLLEKKIFKFRPGVAYNTATEDYVVTPIIERDAAGNIARWKLNANTAEKIFPAPDVENPEIVQHIINIVATTLETIKKGYCSEPGNLVVINNKKAAHSRTPLSAKDKLTVIDNQITSLCNVVTHLNSEKHVQIMLCGLINIALGGGLKLEDFREKGSEKLRGAITFRHFDDRIDTVGELLKISCQHNNCLKEDVLSLYHAEDANAPDNRRHLVRATGQHSAAILEKVEIDYQALIINERMKKPGGVIVR